MTTETARDDDASFDDRSNSSRSVSGDNYKTIDERRKIKISCAPQESLIYRGTSSFLLSLVSNMAVTTQVATSDLKLRVNRCSRRGSRGERGGKSENS